jgi:hypothetical protein
MDKIIKDRDTRKVQIEHLKSRLFKLGFVPPQPLETQYSYFLDEFERRLRTETPEKAWNGAGLNFIKV